MECACLLVKVRSLEPLWDSSVYYVEIQDMPMIMSAKSIDSNPRPVRPRDRGPAPFFHGREEIIDNFKTVLGDSKALKDGTTFMIQGAPGAGKTALLDVLSNYAKKWGWKTVHIPPSALWNQHELSPLLRKKSGRQITGLGAGGSIANIVSANLSVGIKPSSHTIIKLLRKQKKPLLLTLDEAQTLGLKDAVPPEMKGIVISVLKQIHNGDLGKPVMLLTGGLGTTKAAYGSLGISRFEGDCTVQLGRLDKKSECAVIRDWLIKDGRAKGDPHIWIKSIAEHAHGWPQHIMSYIKPAVEYLKSTNHLMTDEGLEFVLAKGAKYRKMYYQTRADDIDKKKRQILAKIFADVPLGETMYLEDIMSVLENEYTPEVAEKLFKKALERGIIDERKDGDYGIPIPSFHTWLVDEYAKGKSQDIQPPPKGLPPQTESFSPPPTREDQEGTQKDKDAGEGKHKGRGGFSMER